MPDQPSCFGTIFPNLVQLEYNTPVKGTVFTVLVRSTGMWGQSRTVEVDQDAWQRCQACPSYQACYDLGMATLQLHTALTLLR
jgi:hypothetical protein